MVFNWNYKPIAKGKINKPSGQALKALAGINYILEGMFNSILSNLPFKISVNHVLILYRI